MQRLQKKKKPIFKNILEVSEIKPLSFQSFALLLVPVTTSYHRDPSPVKTNKGKGVVELKQITHSVLRSEDRREETVLGCGAQQKSGGLDELSAVVLHRRQGLLGWKWRILVLWYRLHFCNY